MMHTLDTITLSDFIKLVMGDLSFAGDSSESEYDKSMAANAMIQEYSTIVGGKSLLASIQKQNSELNNLVKIELMDACETLIKLDMWQDVCTILGMLGFNFNQNDQLNIDMRIKAIRASCKMKMELAPKKEKEEFDADYFTKERVVISTHYKMHIDINVWKAKEYAYLVKTFCDEMKKSMRGK